MACVLGGCHLLAVWSQTSFITSLCTVSSSVKGGDGSGDNNYLLQSGDESKMK